MDPVDPNPDSDPDPQHCFKGTLRQVFICLRPEPPLARFIRVYIILIHSWKGRGAGRVEPDRRLEGQQFTKLGRKYQRD